jgi:hypothetical protein
LVQKWYDDILELLKGMVDVSMFLEWHFLLMSLSTILLFTWFIVPYFYLAEIMVRNGYTEQEASKLLSVIGMTNFLGMVRTLRPSLHTDWLSGAEHSSRGHSTVSQHFMEPESSPPHSQELSTFPSP